MGTVSINGTPTTVSLLTAVTASTITINGNQTLSTNGVAHTLNAKSLTNNGTFTGTGSIINLSGTGGTLTNGGTWSVAGSTLNLTGLGSQNIDAQGGTFGMIVDSNTSTGGVNFLSNLIASRLYANPPTLSAGINMNFAAGGNFAISSVTLTGSSPNPVTLRSTSPGTAWQLNNVSSNTVTFVDVEDSDARQGITIQANQAGGFNTNTNSGHNINWNFGNTGQIVTATKTGNWSSSSTWDQGFVPTASNAVVIPNGFTVTEDITAAAASLTINNSGSTTGLTFSGASQLTVSNATTCSAPAGGANSTITIGAGTFIANGSLTLNGGSTGICQITMAAGTLTLGNGMTFGGTVANTGFNNTAAGTINLQGGSISGAAGTFTVNIGTLLKASGSSGIGGAYTFGALSVPSGNLDLGNFAITFASATSVTGILDAVTGAGTYVFAGTVTVNASGIFDLSAENPALTFFQGITMNGTTFNAGTGAVSFTTNNQALAGNGNMIFGGTVTPSTGKTITNNNTATVTIGGTLALSGNWTQGVNSDLVLSSSSATSGSGTLTAAVAGSTVNYSGAGVTVRPVAYNKLILSGSGVYTLTGVTTINSDFNVQGSVAATSVVNTVGGNLNLSGTAALTLGDNLAVAGTLNVTGSGSLTDGNFTVGVTGLTTIGGTYTHSGNAAVTLTGGVLVNGTLNGSGTGSIVISSGIAGAGTVNLTGNTFEQRVSANQSFFATSGSNNWAFNNLTFSDSSGATPFTVTTQTGGSGGITVTGVLTLGEGTDTQVTTLNPGNQIWTLSNSGTPLVFNAGGSLCAHGTCPTNTSTFQYTGNAATTIAARLGYFNLNVNPTITGAVADTTGGAITVANNFLLNPTAASANGLTITLGGAFTVSVGTLTVDGTTNGFGVLDTDPANNFAITAHALTIAAGASGAVNNLNANNSVITLTGTGTPFTINASFATFTEGNSTVNYTGNGATILTMGNVTASTNSYHSLGLLPGGASSQVLGSGNLGSGALDVNGNLTIGDGIHTGGATASANNLNINLYGNLTINANAVYSKGTGTTSFKKSGTQVWTDNTAGQDLGTVSVSGSNSTVNLGSNVIASTITISPSQTFSTNGAHTLNAQTIINNGTLSALTELSICQARA